MSEGGQLDYARGEVWRAWERVAATRLQQPHQRRTQVSPATP
jgi:hypothetical protein